MKIDLPGWDDPKVNILQLVSGWLSNDMREPWLLVFDNADDEELFLPNPLPLGDERTPPLLYYLPQAPNGSTLITTRDKRVAVDISCDDGLIEILPMTKSEAKDLLSKRLRLRNSGLNDLNSDELCKALEYLPLAITQAASFIIKNGSTVDEYLEVFHASDSEMQNLLSEEMTDRRRNLQGFGIANSVIRAWKVTFDQIIKQDFRASEILSLMAVLDGQRVPKMLLNQSDTNRTDFIKAVGTLKAFSFISEETGAATFMMHRLVQVSTRKWLTLHGEIAKWQEMALKAVTTSFPFDSDDIENWKTCEALLPHVKIVLEYTYESNECLLKKQAEIRHKVSSYNCLAGRWDEAYEQASKAYEIRREMMGSEHPLTLTVMYIVARTLFNRSEYKAADSMFQQHFNLTKRILGSEHQETLRSMAFVAFIQFFYKGQFSEGEESYRTTLELRERALGLDHPDTLTGMANLGLMLRRQGKRVAAVEMHRKALMHQQKLLGYQHPDTLVSLDYLSQALTATGDHKSAEEMCRAALQSQESRLGPKHPKTFQIKGTLAYVLSGQRRYEDSEKIYRQVLAMRKEVLGIDHRDTIMNIISLGGVLESQGMFEQAEELYRESLQGITIRMGSEHPDTINCLLRLAGVLRTQGKPDAEAMTRKLLELQEKTLRVPDEFVMLTIHSLASQLGDRQDYSGAEKMLRKLMELRKQVFGLESDEVIRLMRQLMFNLGDQGKPEEALEMCQSLRELQIKVFSNEHPETIKTTNNLASWLHILGRQEEYQDERQKSIELQEKILDDDHPNSVTKLNRSAQSFENEGKHQEAIEAYQEALRLQLQVLGFNHAKTVSTALEIQHILGYTGSELDLPHGQRPRILWLLAPERLLEFTSRFPTRCDPHSRLFQVYARLPNSRRAHSPNESRSLETSCGSTKITQ